jgi:FkbM family methyltransferase
MHRTTDGRGRVAPPPNVRRVMSETDRVRLTTSCRDADQIPKVSGAGDVLDTADGRVQLMHNGVRVVEGCYYGAWMTEIIRTLGGHHEPQEELVVHEIIERLASDTVAPVMIELGAFWAYYTLWLLQRRPDARAILVEPDPNNLDAGRANVALNKRQVEWLQAAVGADPAPPASFVCESDGMARPVATESLGSLMARFDVNWADLVLADIQGAETAMLEGAAHFLARSVRFLVVSTHHYSISGDPLTHDSCLALLKDAGAHVIAEHTVAESFSGDGLIAVSFDPRDSALVGPTSRARAGERLFGEPLAALSRALARQRTSGEQAAVAVGELATARQELAAARIELQTMEATTTWRSRGRLLGGRAGRVIARVRPRRSQR